MEYLIKLLVVVMFALGSASVLACPYPKDPEFVVPDGAQATKDEMIATQGNVKAYVSSVESYLTCLDKRLAKFGEQASEEQTAIYTLRYDAAVDAMEMVADKFNVALRAYKDAQ